jgi:uncharacterized SAM-binding protein YcdF (DUF218 family)
MYFILSKTVGLLTVPSNLVVVILAFGLLLWGTRLARLGRRITAGAVIFLLVAGATPIGTLVLLPLEDRFPQWNETHGPPYGIVVLGGILDTDVSLERNDIAFGQAAERLIAAVELSRRFPDARVVFSGGNANVLFPGVPEADVAVRFLQQLGIPNERILIDRTSRNTFENALYSKQIAAPRPGERWLLVTSAAHMPRAIGLFRAAGFPVEAYPVGWKTAGWQDLVKLPDGLLSGFQRLDLATHEWIGLLTDRLVGRTAVLFPSPITSLPQSQ